MPPVLVGTYTRRIRASVARVWENVLDWEHLPWLHGDTFAFVRLEHGDARGWRAESGLHDGQAFTIEVTIDRAAGHYHSRTVAGAGAGSDVVTRLSPVDAANTDIHVEFWVPDVPEAHIDAMGAFFTSLYRRLWDEDEAMMRRRQALLDAPPARTTPITMALGARHTVQERLPWILNTGAGPVRIVDDQGTLRAHPTTCPHLGGPLEDTALEDGCITCPWHGYRFDLRRGNSAVEHDLPFEASVRIVADTSGDLTLSID